MCVMQAGCTHHSLDKAAQRHDCGQCPYAPFAKVQQAPFAHAIHTCTQVRAALGIRRTVVSGGGSLPPHLDDFFEAAGLTVLVGYGLTETAPVLTCRRCVWGFAWIPCGCLQFDSGRPRFDASGASAQVCSFIMVQVQSHSHSSPRHHPRAQPGANIRGSVGLPIPGTQLRIVNPETMQEVPDGTQGLVLARGPGVMRG